MTEVKKSYSRLKKQKRVSAPINIHLLGNGSPEPKAKPPSIALVRVARMDET